MKGMNPHLTNKGSMFYPIAKIGHTQYRDNFTIASAISRYLVRHPLLEKKMRRFGRVVLPFVLIGLGLYIMTEAFLLS
jgi:hypothetical protein